ncbi:MAG: cobalamin biosynthesis protein CobD [Leptolyngbya sp. SIO4C1]|nr:cobalamin biosynthesis protein CobD [Leptolyngbya sp. SIO4C1]
MLALFPLSLAAFPLPPDICLFVLAAGLDYLIADPWSWPHPVQAMGSAIAGISRLCLSAPPRWHRLLGVGLGIGLTAGSGFMAAGLIALTYRCGGSAAGLGLEVILLASCFAGRSLRRAAAEVLRPLSQANLPEARQRLACYVGRDTEQLSAADSLRAVLETVSENATDGVLAPLFYALLGALLGVGSVPLAVAYKAASTLDSMVGYRRAPYARLGWFSARLEDGLTWVPCRLVVLTVGLLSGRPGQVWQLCCRDAIADPSPNAGWSECAYAAALGVQLGGKNTYRGEIIFKPLLGEPERAITARTIDQALNLTRRCFLLWLGLGLAALWLKG